MRGHPGLRGLHGFESRRLPGSGAQGVGRQLAAAAAARLASTPWLDGSLYHDPIAAAALEQAAHLVDPSSTGTCESPPAAAYEADEGGMCVEEMWEEEPGVPSDHLANALAALGLLATPLAGGLHRDRESFSI